MKSNYVGVSHQSIGSNWFARIRVNGKRIHLGAYNTQEEAAGAIVKANYELRGKNVSLEDLRRNKVVFDRKDKIDKGFNLRCYYEGGDGKSFRYRG